MKKIFHFCGIAALLVAVTSAQAQNHPLLSLKGGLAIANLSTNTPDNPLSSGYTSRTGTDFGARIEFPLSKKFSIEPGLEFLSLGAQKNGAQGFLPTTDDRQALAAAGETDPYLYANYNSTLKLNYISVPVLAKYHFDLGRKFGAYVSAGPYLSLLTSAKNVSTGSSSVYTDAAMTQLLMNPPQSFENTTDIKSNLRSTNTGLDANVGVSYKMRSGEWFAEAGRGYGFTNIQTDVTQGQNKTKAGIIELGYQFRL